MKRQVEATAAHAFWPLVKTSRPPASLRLPDQGRLPASGI